jgi:hypothetical protein
MDEGSCLFQVMNFQWLDMYSCSDMENQAEAQSLKILMNKWSFLYVSVLFLLKDVVLVARFETGRDGFVLLQRLIGTGLVLWFRVCFHPEMDGIFPIFLNHQVEFLPHLQASGLFS